jgi:hypothetical protein
MDLEAGISDLDTSFHIVRLEEGGAGFKRINYYIT